MPLGFNTGNIFNFKQNVMNKRVTKNPSQPSLLSRNIQPVHQNRPSKAKRHANFWGL